MSRAILVLSFLLASVASAQDSGPDWVRLQGNKDTVKLLWEPKQWPAGTQGFNVKRRVPGGAWQTLNIRPILPTLYPEDMDTRTNDPALRAELKEIQLRIVKYMPEFVLPLDELLEQFADPKRLDDKVQGVLIEYAMALAYGFAYQDVNVPQGGTYEYALFGIARDGKEGAEPIAVRSWKWGSVPTLKLSFGKPVLERQPGPAQRYMRVIWPVPPEELRPNLVRFLRVYLVGPDGNKTVWKDRYSAEIRSYKVMEISLEGLNQPGVFRLYAVPVDFFDFEGTPSPAVTYEWARYRELLLKPPAPGPVFAPNAPPPEPRTPPPRR